MPTKDRSMLAFLALSYSLGFFLWVNNASAQNKSETQAQKVTTAESPTVAVDTINIDGGTELSAEDRTSIANSLQGETTHSDWLNRLKANATRQLENDGFFDVTAEAKVQSTKLLDGKEHVTVLVALTGGKRYSVQKVWWAGSSVFSLAQLNNLGLLQVGDVFSRSALSESLSLLRQAYADRGYGQMVVVPQFEKFPESGKVTLYFDITEGQKSGENKPLQCKQYSAEDVQKTPYAPSPSYDPKLDGQLQIARAQLEAQRTNKKLLLIAGDKSCGWCRLLDQTFQRNPATIELRDKLFIVLHIDVSEDNSNECALRSYPKPPGFPFIYVLDATGKLLGTEDTKDWAWSDGYNPHRIEAFLTMW
jgi:hypothetical protein